LGSIRKVCLICWHRSATFLGKSPGAGLFGFAENLGSPMSLKELGLSEQDLDRAAEIAAANPYWNPRQIDQTSLRAMLQDAFDGTMPPDSNN